MLYRIKGDDAHRKAVTDSLELVSPVIGELARIFHLVEKGELDIWKEPRRRKRRPVVLTERLVS